MEANKKPIGFIRALRNLHIYLAMLYGLFAVSESYMFIRFSDYSIGLSITTILKALGIYLACLIFIIVLFDKLLNWNKRKEPQRRILNVFVFLCFRLIFIFLLLLIPMPLFNDSPVLLAISFFVLTATILLAIPTKQKILSYTQMNETELRETLRVMKGSTVTKK